MPRHSRLPQALPRHCALPASHFLEVVAGMIAGPGQRRCGDQQEALGTRYCRIGIERLRGDELLDPGVARGRLEILAHGQEIDARRAHVVHHLVNLEPLLAQADHQARLGEDVRRPALDALEQSQRGIIARPGRIVG